MPLLGTQIAEAPEREEEDTPKKLSTLLSFGKMESAGKESQKESDKEEK